MQKTFEVKTGFGYFKDQDGVTYCKAELPVGTHPIKDNFSYIEVTSKTALDAVNINKTESEEVLWKRKIQDEVYLIAEERLIARGEKKPISLKVK